MKVFGHMKMELAVASLCPSYTKTYGSRGMPLRGSVGSAVALHWQCCGFESPLCCVCSAGMLFLCHVGFLQLLWLYDDDVFGLILALKGVCLCTLGQTGTLG